MLLTVSMTLLAPVTPNEEESKKKLTQGSISSLAEGRAAAFWGLALTCLSVLMEANI